MARAAHKARWAASSRWRARRSQRHADAALSCKAGARHSAREGARHDEVMEGSSEGDGRQELKRMEFNST